MSIRFIGGKGLTTQMADCYAALMEGTDTSIRTHGPERLPDGKEP